MVSKALFSTILIATSLWAAECLRNRDSEVLQQQAQDKPKHEKHSKKHQKQEEPEATEEPSSVEEKPKKKGGLGAAIRNFFAEETTTPEPTWNGMPLYYQNVTPPEFVSMAHDQRQDFYFRVWRWHEEELERKQLHRCRQPQPGEKLVYFIQHGECIPKMDDAPLFDLGVFQSVNIRFDPLMQKAMKNPKYRPQALMVSPARKALQTAVWAFSDIYPDIPWKVNSDIRGFGWVEGTVVTKLGSKALYDLASNSSVFLPTASNLLKQYRNMSHAWDLDKPHKDRWYDFMKDIQNRPEDRFIVISHGGMIKQANISKTHGGMVHLRALQPDMSWRQLSPPDCWDE